MNHEGHEGARRYAAPVYLLKLKAPPRRLYCDSVGQRSELALERGVEAEDVADLECCAVIHHQVATDYDVDVVRRRRRKHRFQFPWTGLHLPSQARRQGAVHNQLALKSGRQAIAFR